MNLTTNQINAIYKLYPQTASTQGDKAYDAEGKEVKYNLADVTAQAKKDECVENCKQLLQASDWSVLPDVGLQNQADYVLYRSILRNYVINPVENPDYPTLPTPIWS